MTKKTMEERLKECININMQLKSLGVFSCPEVKEKVAHHMNNFVKLAASQTFSVRVLGTETQLNIILTTNSQRQSGVTLVQK